MTKIHVKLFYRIVSYRIVSYRILSALKSVLRYYIRF